MIIDFEGKGTNKPPNYQNNFGFYSFIKIDPQALRKTYFSLKSFFIQKKVVSLQHPMIKGL